MYVSMKQSNEMTEERIIVKADRDIYYPGVESFREVLNLAQEDIRPVKLEEIGRNPCLIIDLSNVSEIDYTSLKVLYFFCFLYLFY